MIVDCALYADGRRSTMTSTEDALTEARRSGGFAWIGLHEPSLEEFDGVADVFRLHPLAVEDAVGAHERPKVEWYGDNLLAVFKPARYVDSDEVVEVDQIIVFVGETFVVTVGHGAPAWVASVAEGLAKDAERLEWGPVSALYAIADRVVDDYFVVMRGLDQDIDEIAEDVFSGPSSAHAERIFKLKREVIDFRRAVDPLLGPLESMANGTTPVDKRSSHYFRDVYDHLLRVSTHLSGLDALLDSALNANVAQVGMRQNEDMRKITAWAAIIAVSTLIAGVYGMNFEFMPELRWRLGYPFALVLMASASLLLYLNFKKHKWL